jgi:hypothetical protein
VQNTLRLTGIGLFDWSDLDQMAGNGWRLRGSGAGRRRRGLAAAGGGGSSENHVNPIPATVLTRVWHGRRE